MIERVDVPASKRTGRSSVAAIVVPRGWLVIVVGWGGGVSFCEVILLSDGGGGGIRDIKKRQ